MTMTGFLWPLDWLFEVYAAKPKSDLSIEEDREAAKMTVDHPQEELSHPLILFHRPPCVLHLMTLLQVADCL